MTTAYTFKEKVADDARKYLGKKDELYPNLKFHTWGEIMPEDIKWGEVHQVHDLVSEKFFYKVPVPFENNFMGMSVESNNAAYIFKNAEDDKDFDLSQLVDGLKKRNDVVAFRIAYPNKYGIQNNLIMLIPRDEYEECSDVKAKEAYIGINAYINLVLRKSIHRTWAEIKNAPTLDDKTLHWIWFRKPGYVLPMEIAERVRSWVDYNPDMSFILWTDLKDEAELGEFLKDAKGVWPDGDKICVKYLEDTLDFVKSYFETHKNEDEVKAFDRETYVGLIRDRVYNRTMIAKTDYLRAMILHHFGGFYADLTIVNVSVRYDIGLKSW
jgi:hypothetical protein